MRKFLLSLLMLVIVILTFAAKEITICWASWPPADALLALSEEFTKKTGIKVKGLFVPWGQFMDKVSVEFAAKSPTIDILIADSQWLGWLVELVGSRGILTPVGMVGWWVGYWFANF